MELSYFNKMRTIHNTLYSEGFTFTEMDLKDRISFSESVNAGEELIIGSCVMSTIEFSLFDLNYLLDDITGKEFTWVKSVQTEQNSYKKLARAARAGVVCINGAVSYVFNSRPPYISIWDTELVYKLSEPEPQPSQAVEGAAVVGNTLYCFHPESPYLTAYRISGQGLSQISAPALNRFHQEKIREYCKMGYSCNLQGDILKEYHLDLYDQKPVNLIETVFERIQMGIFKAEKPVKSNDTLIKVSCTDRLNLFDRYVDSWLNQINYPTTIGNLLRGLCAFVGIQAESYSFLNSDFQVKRNFIGQNTNGLQVLRWIAGAAACFGKITPSGTLKLGWYEPLDYTLNESVYRSITNEEYQVKKIDKLQVRVVENDIGVIVPEDDPSRTNAYIIENNPLLYAETDAELRPTAQKIFNAIKDITYHPYSVTLPQNPLIHAGNIITVSTRKGLRFSAYIMNRENKAGMDSFSAVGDSERRVQSDAANQFIQQIRGSVHTMTQTIEQLNSTITEYREETTDSLNKVNEDLSNFTDQVAGDLSGLQAQIDGQIESWFYDYEPTLNNPPASDWTTTGEKDKHLGDLFYNSKTGIGYRFSKTGNTYRWEILKDTDIGKALADAQKAQDTADGKRRVFVAAPKPPYDVGDLWANATYQNLYSNDLLRCKTARAAGVLNINDWEKASKYTDDTKADDALSKITIVQSEIKQLSDEISLRVTQTQVDQSIAESEAAINEALKDYALKSEVKITTDAISLEVSKKLSSEEFSTRLRVSSEDVQIAWNGISKVIQFEEGELRIYDSPSPTTQKILTAFTDEGVKYFYNEEVIGTIGTSSITGQAHYRGLDFCIEPAGSYMGWAIRKETAEEGSLIMGYFSDSDIEAHGLHFFSKAYAEQGIYFWDNTEINVIEIINSSSNIMRFGGRNSEVEYHFTTSGTNIAKFTLTGNHFYKSLNMHNNSILNNSDVRLKTNISDTNLNVLEGINQLSLKQFDWILTQEHENIGIIAQQLQKIFPDLVDENKNTGLLSIKINKFIPYFIKSIQELYSIINPIMISNARDSEIWKDYSISEKKKFIKQVEQEEMLIEKEHSLVPEIQFYPLRKDVKQT